MSDSSSIASVGDVAPINEVLHDATGFTGWENDFTAAVFAPTKTAPKTSTKISAADLEWPNFDDTDAIIAPRASKKDRRIQQKEFAKTAAKKEEFMNIGLSSEEGDEEEEGPYELPPPRTVKSPPPQYDVVDPRPELMYEKLLPDPTTAPPPPPPPDLVMPQPPPPTSTTTGGGGGGGTPQAPPPPPPLETVPPPVPGTLLLPPTTKPKVPAPPEEVSEEEEEEEEEASSLSEKVTPSTKVTVTTPPKTIPVVAEETFSETESDSASSEVEFKTAQPGELAATTIKEEKLQQTIKKLNETPPPPPAKSPKVATPIVKPECGEGSASGEEEIEESSDEFEFEPETEPKVVIAPKVVVTLPTPVVPVTPKPGSKKEELEAIPRLDIVDFEEMEKRGEEKKLVTPEEIESMLAPHSINPGQIAEAQKSTEAMEKLRRALSEFHGYMWTPEKARAAVFANAYFTAKSKNVTLSMAAQVHVAQRAVQKLKVLSTKQDILLKDDSGPAAEAESTTSNLDRRISDALWHFIESQNEVDETSRKAISLALVADVVHACSDLEIGGVIKVLASTFIFCLLSEAFALRVAAGVSGEKGAKYDALFQKILRDIDAFIGSVTSLSLTPKAAEKTRAKISSVSKTFQASALRFAPIAGPEGKPPSRSYATELSLLFAKFVRHHPISRTIAKGSVTTADFGHLFSQTFLLMPKTITLPMATHDVLSGFLTGIANTITATNNAGVQKQISDWAKQLKEIVASFETEFGLQMHTEAKLESTTTTPISTPFKSAAAAAVSSSEKKPPQSATEVKTVKFLRRFEAELVDD